MRTKLYLVYFYFAVFYGLTFLVCMGFVPAWGEWYCQSSDHRKQAESLLRGDLALSHNVADLEKHLTWSEGGVHQVSGLGISIWQLPFDLTARLFGQSLFPDQLAFGIFTALAAGIAFATFAGPMLANKDRHPYYIVERLECFGSILLVLAFPPFLRLSSARGGVENEVLDYVYLFGVALGCGLFSLARVPTWNKFWALCGLAGVGGLVRPTLVFYGIATTGLATITMHLAASRESPPKSGGGCRWQAPLKLGIGISLFLAGCAVLWWTNLLRFGDGFEFGHKLNVFDNDLNLNVYAIRFDSPYQKEPIFRAAHELFGALFQYRPAGRGAFAQNLFPGQSLTFRYRDMSFATFDWSCLAFIAAGWTVAVSSAWSLRKSLNRWSEMPSANFVLAAWSCLASVALIGFYLRVPFIASRYMMDFAPAFAFASVVFWQWLMTKLPVSLPRARQMRAALFVALLGWFVWQAADLGGTIKDKSVRWEAVAEEEKSLFGHQPRELPDGYTLKDDLASWNIPCNGAGWDTQTGQLSSCAILFVNTPEFLELNLEPTADPLAGQAQVETIRAKVGLEFLERQAIERTDKGWRIRFLRPRNPHFQNGIQQVSIAAVPPELLARNHSDWRLTKVTWRTPK